MPKKIVTQLILTRDDKVWLCKLAAMIIKGVGDISIGPAVDEAQGFADRIERLAGLDGADVETLDDRGYWVKADRG